MGPIVLKLGRVTRRVEDGFSLVETVVAISLLAGMFIATAALLTKMFLGAVYARRNQQSIDLISEEIERLRVVGYAGTTMVEADLTADPSPHRWGPVWRLRADRWRKRDRGH